MLWRIYSVSISAKTKDNLTALEIAKSKGFEDVYSRLMSHRRVGSSSTSSTSSTASSSSKPVLRDVVRQHTQAQGGAASGSAGSSDFLPALPQAQTQSVHQQQQQQQQVQSVARKISSSDKDHQEKAVGVGVGNHPSSSALGGLVAVAATAPDHYSQSKSSESEVTVTALRKQIEIIRDSVRIADAKVDMLKDQNTTLLAELSATTAEVSSLLLERDELQATADRLCGRPSALEGITLEECTDLERLLKFSLESLEARKATLIKEALGQQKEQRLCVVCQASEKSVVLLPCRHMCLCDVCSTHEQLTHCPLCRRPIAHRISVYS